MAQPIARGIQAVGSVSINYRYNSTDGILPIPPGWSFDTGLTGIDTNGAAGVEVAGFRLDGEFLRAVQQIASSIVVPILGGGGVALTNNNRTGSLTIASSRVSSPLADGSMSNLAGGARAFDLVLLAQCQQAARGGDSVGATITVSFDFNGMGTKIEFQGCTIANVAPVALAGNDVANYAVTINYLNWVASFSSTPIAT